MSPLVASSRRNRPGPAQRELDPVVAVDGRSGADHPSAEHVAVQRRSARVEVGDGVDDTARATRPDGRTAGPGIPRARAAAAGGRHPTWASCTTMPWASLGWRNASSHSGSSRFSPTGDSPAARTRSSAASRSGTLKVMWCGPGPFRARKRCRNAPFSAPTGWRPSTTKPLAKRSWVHLEVGSDPAVDVATAQRSRERGPQVRDPLDRDRHVVEDEVGRRRVVVHHTSSWPSSRGPSARLGRSCRALSAATPPSVSLPWAPRRQADVP